MSEASETQVAVISFSDKYTTQEEFDKDPIANKDKIIISNDKYAELEVSERNNAKLCFALRRRG